MKTNALNKKMKGLITALATALLVDLWRNFPWMRRVAEWFTTTGEEVDEK